MTPSKTMAYYISQPTSLWPESLRNTFFNVPPAHRSSFDAVAFIIHCWLTYGQREMTFKEIEGCMPNETSI